MNRSENDSGSAKQQPVEAQHTSQGFGSNVSLSHWHMLPVADTRETDNTKATRNNTNATTVHHSKNSSISQICTWTEHCTSFAVPNGHHPLTLSISVISFSLIPSNRLPVLVLSHRLALHNPFSLFLPHTLAIGLATQVSQSASSSIYIWYGYMWYMHSTRMFLNLTKHYYAESHQNNVMSLYVSTKKE